MRILQNKSTLFISDDQWLLEWLCGELYSKMLCVSWYHVSEAPFECCSHILKVCYKLYLMYMSMLFLVMIVNIEMMINGYLSLTIMPVLIIQLNIVASITHLCFSELIAINANCCTFILDNTDLYGTINLFGYDRCIVDIMIAKYL